MNFAPSQWAFHKLAVNTGLQVEVVDMLQGS